MTDTVYRAAAIDEIRKCRFVVQAIEKIRKLPSAEPQWIPFKTRPLTDEEKADKPDWAGVLDCPLPHDGQRILVSIKCSGHEAVQLDEYYEDYDGSYLDSGYELVAEATAWMPLPEPYKGERRWKK